MRKVIGLIIFLSPFIAWFVFAVQSVGWLFVLAIVGGIVLVVGTTVFGLWLMETS